MSTADLNATQGSLLGFLHEGPKTGWELLQEVERGLQRFWNVTSSHVYRELRTLEQRGLVAAGAPGPRDRRPFSITKQGRAAFREWIAQPPAPEQIRFPLLVTLWFGKHLDDATLRDVLEANAKEHRDRLDMYRDAIAHTDDEYVASVVQFGIEYERAVLRWLRGIATKQTSAEED
jgi:DNA-binding PadR family transcriptional regulator